jgi:hypothetical protein
VHLVLSWYFRERYYRLYLRVKHWVKSRTHPNPSPAPSPNPNPKPNSDPYPNPTLTLTHTLSRSRTAPCGGARATATSRASPSPRRRRSRAAGPRNHERAAQSLHTNTVQYRNALGESGCLTCHPRRHRAVLSGEYVLRSL